MKIHCDFLNFFDKDDWNINLIPGIGIGNQVYGYGLTINISWIVWVFHLSIYLPPSFKGRKTYKNAEEMFKDIDLEP